MKSNHLTTYLRLLGGFGVPEKADYWAVPELINAGLAQGHVHAESTTGRRVVVEVIDFTPTVQGRLMADDLAERARKSTWRYRLMQTLFGLLTFSAGWVAGVFSEVAKSLLSKALGL